MLTRERLRRLTNSLRQGVGVGVSSTPTPTRPSSTRVNVLSGVPQPRPSSASSLSQAYSGGGSPIQPRRSSSANARPVQAGATTVQGGTRRSGGNDFYMRHVRESVYGSNNSPPPPSSAPYTGRQRRPSGSSSRPVPQRYVPDGANSRLNRARQLYQQHGIPVSRPSSVPSPVRTPRVPVRGTPATVGRSPRLSSLARGSAIAGAIGLVADGIAGASGRAVQGDWRGAGEEFRDRVIYNPNAAKEVERQRADAIAAFKNGGYLPSQKGLAELARPSSLPKIPTKNGVPGLDRPIPLPPPPPFQGGQEMGRTYWVEVWGWYQLHGAWNTKQPFHDYRAVFGKVYGVELRTTGALLQVAALAHGQQFQVQPIHTPLITWNPASSVFALEIEQIRVTRTDGLPDTSGNPPPLPGVVSPGTKNPLIGDRHGRTPERISSTPSPQVSSTPNPLTPIVPGIGSAAAGAGKALKAANHPSSVPQNRPSGAPWGPPLSPAFPPWWQSAAYLAGAAAIMKAPNVSLTNINITNTPPAPTPGGGGQPSFCAYDSRNIKGSVDQNNLVIKAVQGYMQGEMMAKLDVIDGKLGAQLPNGGIGGLLKRTWDFLQIDRVINILTYITVLHNAYMLSNQLSQTLFSAFGRVLNVFGIKEADGSDLEVGKIVGQWTDNFFKAIFGVETVDGTKAIFKAANRIYQAASNLWWAMQSIFMTVTSLFEVIASMNAQVANVLKKWGVIGQEFPWFNPNPNFKINAFMSKLYIANEIVEAIDAVAGEILEAREIFGEQLPKAFEQLQNTLKGKMPDGSDAPKGPKTPEHENTKTEQTQAETDSKSPPISPQDMRKPEG